MYAYCVRCLLFFYFLFRVLNISTLEAKIVKQRGLYDVRLLTTVFEEWVKEEKCSLKIFSIVGERKSFSIGPKELQRFLVLILYFADSEVGSLLIQFFYGLVSLVLTQKGLRQGMTQVFLFLFQTEIQEKRLRIRMLSINEMHQITISIQTPDCEMTDNHFSFQFLLSSFSLVVSLMYLVPFLFQFLMSCNTRRELKWRVVV